MPDELPATKPAESNGPVAAAATRRAANSVLTLPLRAFRLSLVSNAFFLMLNTAVSSVLGATFWLIAARLYTASDVGFAAAVIPLIGLLSNMGTLGLAVGLIRYLPEAESDPDRTRWMVNTSLTLSAVSAMSLGLVFLLGITVWSPSLSFLRNDLRVAAAFVAFCGLFAFGPILDGAAIEIGRAHV